MQENFQINHTALNNLKRTVTIFSLILKMTRLMMVQILAVVLAICAITSNADSNVSGQRNKRLITSLLIGKVGYFALYLILLLNSLNFFPIELTPVL